MSPFFYAQNGPIPSDFDTNIDRSTKIHYLRSNNANDLHASSPLPPETGRPVLRNLLYRPREPPRPSILILFVPKTQAGNAHTFSLPFSENQYRSHRSHDRSQPVSQSQNPQKRGWIRLSFSHNKVCFILLNHFSAKKYNTVSWQNKRRYNSGNLFVLCRRRLYV